MKRPLSWWIVTCKGKRFYRPKKHFPADGLLEILSVDENGHAVCKTDLPFGNFYFKELSTDEHYILSDEKHPIVFDYAGQ